MLAPFTVFHVPDYAAAVLRRIVAAETRPPAHSQSHPTDTHGIAAVPHTASHPFTVYNFIVYSSNYHITFFRLFQVAPGILQNER